MPPKKVEAIRHKDEQDREDLAVPVVPIYIQEKIHPQAIIEALPRTDQPSDNQFNLIKASSPLIDPIYSQSEPSQRIDLGRVAVQFDYKGTALQDMANVGMRFVPGDRLEFVCPLEGKSPMVGLGLFDDAGRDIKLTLTDTGIIFDAFCAAVGGAWPRGILCGSDARSADTARLPE